MTQATKDLISSEQAGANRTTEATGGDQVSQNGKANSIAGDRARPVVREMPGDERSHPLIQLTLARLREFLREPEAVFWVFVFPVLLAFALGIAFRNTAPEKNRIAVENAGANLSA